MQDVLHDSFLHQWEVAHSVKGLFGAKETCLLEILPVLMSSSVDVIRNPKSWRLLWPCILDNALLIMIASCI